MPYDKMKPLDVNGSGGRGESGWRWFENHRIADPAPQRAGAGSNGLVRLVRIRGGGAGSQGGVRCAGGAGDGPSMRVLVMSCHPCDESFTTYVAARVVAVLSSRHQVRHHDLYTGDGIGLLEETEAVVWVYPTWWSGPPAPMAEC